MTMSVPAPAIQVFNADYSPLKRVKLKSAISMLMRQKAYTLEAHDPPQLLRSPSTQIEVPRSLLLVQYQPVPYRRDADHASRSEILARDNHTCQFGGCGARATTIDHVFPRSKGGGNTWFNLVASCESCNGDKGDRTPEEAGMRLVREPFRPAHV